MNKLKMWIILLITNISIINIRISQNTVKIQVSGACGMCKDRIEEAASKVIGVTSADYNLKKQELTVETESIFVKKELVSELLAVGHDTDVQKA